MLLAIVPLIFGEFSKDIAFHAVKLVHIFSAIVLLGGGLMLYLLFRATDLEVDFSAEKAVFRIARRLVYSVWLPSAVAQPITGVLLIYLGEFHWARWLILSLILYFAALLLCARIACRVRRDQSSTIILIRPSDAEIEGTARHLDQMGHRPQSRDLQPDGLLGTSASISVERDASEASGHAVAGTVGGAHGRHDACL